MTVSTHHLGTGERWPGWLALPLGDLGGGIRLVHEVD